VNKKVLFITPGANSAGGNVFMLRFLRWFQANTDIPFSVLCGNGGDLLDEFKEFGDFYRFDRRSAQDNFPLRVFKKLEKKSGIRSWRLKKILNREEFGLIVSNTVVNHETLPLVEDNRAPLLSYCHELESVIHLTGIDRFQRTLKRTDHFIAVSNAVKTELIEKHGVSENDITKVYGFLPVDQFKPQSLSIKNAFRNELGIPEGAFLVGASGSLNWRKAPDVFISLAAKVRQMAPNSPIFFVWIGGAFEGDHSLYCARYDLKKMGLTEQVIFLEHKKEPAKYYAALDVFAMVSREDPFPLVCLESAGFSVPIICFENAGGMPEFVGDECGFVVPYMDIGAFAERIVELFEYPGVKNELGAKAAEKVRKNHDIEKEAPKVLNIIRESLM